MGWLLLLFVVVPIVELYVMVQVAEAIGFWEMLGALLLLSLIGMWVVKYAGFRTWRRLAQAGVTGEPVGKQAADSGLIFLAGVLLVVPGFVTAGLGILLLLPPVRAIVRRRFQRRFVAAKRRGRIIAASYDRDGSRVDGNGMPPRSSPPDPPRGELE